MENPLLAKIRLPGITYRMPSQGLFYHSGELDTSVKNGEVEVFPLTTLDEFTLSMPDKLMSGKAIEEVFARCIPQVKKPLDLLAKDVDYLMVALRQVSFGDDIEVLYKHTCEKAKERKYDINVQEIIRNSKEIDPTIIGEKFSLELPNGQKITMKPMTYGDIVKILHDQAMQKEDEQTDLQLMNITSHTFASVIDSIDGTSDRAFIVEWFEHIPASYKRMIQNKVDGMTDWGTDFGVKRVCKDCKEEIEIQVSANPVSFFT